MYYFRSNARFCIPCYPSTQWSASSYMVLHHNFFHYDSTAICMVIQWKSRKWSTENYPPVSLSFFSLHKIFSPISSQSSSTCDSMKHLYWHTEKNSSERRGKISIKSFNIAKELLSLTMAKNAGLVVWESFSCLRVSGYSLSSWKLDTRT